MFGAKCIYVSGAEEMQKGINIAISKRCCNMTYNMIVFKTFIYIYRTDITNINMIVTKL